MGTLLRHTAALALAAALSVAAAPSRGEEPPAPSPSREERVQALVEEIRRDQSRLLVILTQRPAAKGPLPLRGDQELDRIARRLPALQGELRASGGEGYLLGAPSPLP